MKKLISFFIVISIFLFSFTQDETTELKQEARKIVKEFFTSLSGELKSSMQEGGPSNAIEVCQIKAPEIAAELSKKYGWRIARTSLKVRNPNNSASEWEKNVLENFEERIENGDDPQILEFTEILEIDGRKHFRYMKAIPTSALCLSCHGENISEKIHDKLDELYPDDEAVGFKVGDLRGAFTLSKEL